MADRSKSTFGIDQAMLTSIDWSLAVSRAAFDVRSDFIFAPHFSLIFSQNNPDLISEVTQELKDGRFSPGPPITIEVPKSSRMGVRPRGGLGPSFSRPGSILWPKDRVLYQALADRAAPIVDRVTNPDRSFSHRLSEPKSVEMFQTSRGCWGKMQEHLHKLADENPRSYVVKVDVANCFTSINQHTLVNYLGDSGYPSALKNALDALLVLLTGDRSSRGIIQGVFPSDLLGNFYPTPFDRMLAD